MVFNSDEMLQGTNPAQWCYNLHKKQEDREKKEAETGAIITEMIAAKSSEQTISQLVADKRYKSS